MSVPADDDRRVTMASSHAACYAVPPQQGTADIHSTAYAPHAPSSCGLGHVAGQQVGGVAGHLLPIRLFTDAEVDRTQLCTDSPILRGHSMGAEGLYMADSAAWSNRGRASPNATRLTFARCGLLTEARL